MKTVTFVPQAWINDYAYQCDPNGPTKFEVEPELLVGLEPDSYKSDELRDHANCPDWIKEWSGPFYFTWDTE